MENTKNSVFCSGYNVPSLFQNLQEAWHPPSMLPTIVHGLAFRIIN